MVQIRQIRPRRATVTRPSLKQTFRPGKSIIQIQKEKQKEEEIKKLLSDSIRAFVGSIPNVNLLTNESDKFIRENIRNVPVNLRNQFTTLVNIEKSKVLINRNNLVNSLNRQKESLKLEEKNAQDNLARAKTPSGRANQYAALDNINARRDAINKVLNEIGKGNLFENKTISDFIRQSGNLAGEKRFKRELPKQQKLFATQKLRDDLTKKLNQSIKSLSLERKDAQANLRRAKTPSGKANQLAALSNIKAREKATNDLIKRLKAGEVLDEKKVFEFIKQKGDIAGEKRFFEELQIKRRVEFKKTKFKIVDPETKKIRTITGKELLALKTDNIKVIQDELNVSKKEAEKIEEKINPKEFGGLYVNKAETPKTWAAKLNIWKDRVLFDVEKEPSIAKKIFQKTFVLGGLGILRGLNSLKDTILHPVQTAKGFWQAVTHPFETVKALNNEFVVDPVGTVAAYYTYSKALNLGVKAVKRSPVGRFVQEETFIRSQPKEIRTAVRSIIKSSKSQEAVNPFKVKSIKKVDFAEVQSLTKVEAKALAKTLEQTDSVVFGSVAARTLSKKRTPLPKDVDLATSNINLFNTKFINNLPKNFQKAYKLKGQKIVRIRDGEALMDVKPLQRLYPDRSLLTRKGFLPVSGYVYDIKGNILKKFGIKQKPRIKIADLEIPTQRIQKVGKIKLVGFGEQTTRKGLGTLQVLIEKNVKRAKDPASFIKSLEVQVKGLKLKKPRTPVGKLLNKKKINDLSNALKILKSKDFVKFLEKKVPATKEFPILTKIDIKKLKKAIVKKPVKKLVKFTESKIKSIAKKISKQPLKKAKQTFSKLPKKVQGQVSSLLPAKVRKSILPSKLPKRRPSKLPSKLPKKKPSKLPSKIPKKKPSKIPSKLPSKIPSKLPSKLPVSKLPSSFPPSKPPSKLPSKIPKPKPSRIPISKLPGRLKPKPKPKVKIPLPNLKKKLTKGFNFLVNGRIRIKGKVKVIRLKTTLNRGLKFMISLVDNTTARSFELVVIGVTKAKDITKPNLKKFRPKVASSRVLKLVEKSKFAIDTSGEKRGLTIAKALRKVKNGSRKKITKKKK